MQGQTALKAAFKRKALEGKIRGMVASVYALAPHPQNTNHCGPLFVSLASQFKPAADYDGMLGSMVFEAMLGTAFSSALNDNFTVPVATLANHIDLNNILDCADEYLKDTEKDKKPEEKGQGTFAIGEHRSICNLFNAAESESAEAAFARDLPERLALESAIASAEKTYFALCA